MTLDRTKEPTSEEVSAGVVDLLREVDEALSGDRWAILDAGTPHAVYRMYDAAALRHVCRLLKEIEAAATAEQELSVRILGRAHIEAWLYALYLHFGGFEALQRIADDTQASLVKTSRDFEDFDKWLRKQKREATRKLLKVRRENTEIAKWNRQHSDQSPKPSIDEPHVPQLDPVGIELEHLVAARGKSAKARELPLTAVIAALDDLAPKKGFGRESFVPVYHIYRLISASGPHPTMDLWDGYLIRGGFVRASANPGDFSMITPTRITSLYSTAFLAEWVLSNSGDPTTIATALRAWLEPTAEGNAPWFTAPT